MNRRQRTKLFMSRKETDDNPEQFVKYPIQISSDTLRKMQTVARVEGRSVSEVCKQLLKFGLLYERLTESSTARLVLSPEVNEEEIPKSQDLSQAKDKAINWNLNIPIALHNEFSRTAIKYRMSVGEVIQLYIQMGLVVYEMTRYLGYQLLIEENNKVTEIVLF